MQSTRKVNGFINHELLADVTEILLAFPNCCDVTALLKDFLDDLLGGVRQSPTKTESYTREVVLSRGGGVWKI